MIIGCVRYVMHGGSVLFGVSSWSRGDLDHVGNPNMTLRRPSMDRNMPCAVLCARRLEWRGVDQHRCMPVLTEEITEMPNTTATAEIFTSMVDPPQTSGK